MISRPSPDDLKPLQVPIKAGASSSPRTFNLSNEIAIIDRKTIISQFP